MYARAREASADALAEEALAITRSATNENAQAVRVQFDALRWLAGKRNRGVYAERQQLDVQQDTHVTVSVRHVRAPIDHAPTAKLLPSETERAHDDASALEHDDAHAQTEGGLEGKEGDAVADIRYGAPLDGSSISPIALAQVLRDDGDGVV